MSPTPGKETRGLHDVMRSVDCTTAGCVGVGVRNVAGYPFCSECLAGEPHRVLKAIAQRAEMRRQVDVEAERAGRRHMDELARRRTRRHRQRDRLVARRMSALTQIRRLHEQALARDDAQLAEGLLRAIDVVADMLTRKEQTA